MSDAPHLHPKHHLTHAHHVERAESSMHGVGHGEHLVHQTLGQSNINQEAEDRRRREEATANRLPHVKVTDIEGDKHTLLDRSLSRAERFRAAHELLANHIKEVEFTDARGNHRNIKLDQSAVDGRLRIIEGDRVIMEDSDGRSYTDHLKVRTHPQGVHYSGDRFNGVGSYHQPSGGHRIYSPYVNPRYYNMVQNPDGSKTISFDGCQVDTDGASYHPEDRCWQRHTSLRLSNGESLNTDLDNFVVLSPSLARACGVKLGDCGYLVDKSTGRAVPVVFGDSGPEGKRSAEASVHAIKQFGRNERIDGNHGLEGRFQVVVVPHSGNGTGDLARSPDSIKTVLDARTSKGSFTASS